MPKSKNELMRRLYKERKDAGLVHVSFWIPEKAQQIVKDAVGRAVFAFKGGKKVFWE